MRAFVFVSDVVVAIMLFALALDLLPIALAYQFYGKPTAIFASDVLMMAQQGATQAQISQVFAVNSMCGTISYYSSSGSPLQDVPMSCQCQGSFGSASAAGAGQGNADPAGPGLQNSLYSLAGKTPGGFAKVTVCRK